MFRSTVCTVVLVGGEWGGVVCREFHRKKLARRLLNAGQVEQQEQTFLQRLKQQCGAQFTQKMEGMNNDLATARDKQSDFEKWMQGQVCCRSAESLPACSRW